MLKTSYKGAAVYAIFCETLPRVYIGSSDYLQLRIYNHCTLLRNNKHYNKQLQTDYNAGYKFKLLIFKKFNNIDKELLRIIEYCYMLNCLKSGFELYNIVGVKPMNDESQEQTLNKIIAFNTEFYFTNDYNINKYIKRYYHNTPGNYINNKKRWYEYIKNRIKPRFIPDETPPDDLKNRS